MTTDLRYAAVRPDSTLTASSTIGGGTTYTMTRRTSGVGVTTGLAGTVSPEARA